ncbi:hypothetical protein DFH09DRAFT_1151350 [Mycena vulgaris]|nr:hypothetical protein DFH09DRAFT_1151350 [Mycena vulgaris]
MKDTKEESRRDEQGRGKSPKRRRLDDLDIPNPKPNRKRTQQETPSIVTRPPSRSVSCCVVDNRVLWRASVLASRVGRTLVITPRCFRVGEGGEGCRGSCRLVPALLAAARGRRRARVEVGVGGGMCGRGGGKRAGNEDTIAERVEYRWAEVGADDECQHCRLELTRRPNDHLLRVCFNPPLDGAMALASEYGCQRPESQLDRETQNCRREEAVELIHRLAEAQADLTLEPAQVEHGLDPLHHYRVADRLRMLSNRPRDGAEGGHHDLEDMYVEVGEVDVERRDDAGSKLGVGGERGGRVVDLKDEERGGLVVCNIVAVANIHEARPCNFDGIKAGGR